MAIETRPFASTHIVHFGSDVESLHYVDGNLTIVLACLRDEEGIVQGLKVNFSRPTGFRLLDELDLARYWISDGFSRGSHVLEVKSGGWSAEEDVLQSFETERREWLVVTGNACVSVFCSLEPEFADISWRYDDQACVLARGTDNHPGRLQAIDTGFVQRLRSLTDGVEVDLDAPLSPEDE